MLWQDLTAYSRVCHRRLTVALHPESMKIKLTFEDEEGRLDMMPKISALLVHHRNDRFYTLQLVLEALSIKVIRAQSAQEVEKRLCEMPCPHLVLSDTVLPDGNWMDVLDVAAKAVEPVNVIIVSAFEETRLHLDALDHGAFDFMTDSFTATQIVHILKCATDNVVERRRSQIDTDGIHFEYSQRLTV